MKKLALAFVLLFSLGCEPTEMVTESALIDWILSGEIVKIDSSGFDAADTPAVSIVDTPKGILSPDVVVKSYPVITCNLFGYPEICSMNGSKGRAIGKEDASPSDDDFSVYDESGSELYPGDLTGAVFYSNVWYPKSYDTNASYLTLRGGVAAWGAGWNNARVDFCDIGNPAGTHIHCVQD